MNLVLQLVVGALAGWLTGKAVDGEGLARSVGNRQILDVVCGVIGGVIGGKLFFWIIIGQSSTFTDVAVAVLGAVTVTGVVRLITRKVLA
jgi:uncharacterized membrane protein YeaQ/YmgE (transglycosylase-associated protein family)